MCLLHCTNPAWLQKGWHLSDLSPNSLIQELVFLCVTTTKKINQSTEITFLMLQRSPQSLLCGSLLLMPQVLVRLIFLLIAVLLLLISELKTFPLLVQFTDLSLSIQQLKK